MEATCGSLELTYCHAHTSNLLVNEVNMEDGAGDRQRYEKEH